MSKNSLSKSPLSLLSAGDEFDVQAIIEWFSTRKRHLLFTCAALFALIIVSHRWLSTRTLKDESDFFQAQINFNRFQDANRVDSLTERLADLTQLEAILKQHPELNAKYDGGISQTLIIDRDATRSRPFAESIFHRIQGNHLDLYRDYAETSLLIADEKYSAAALKAEELKEKMNNSSRELYGETLYLFNLFRLAVLYQQLGQLQDELQAWQDVQRYQAQGNDLTAVFQLFKDENVSLQDYIDMRKKELNL